MYFKSCVAVCANGRDVVFPRRIVKCQWEEMFGYLLDRLMAIDCREDDVSDQISL